MLELSEPSTPESAPGHLRPTRDVESTAFSVPLEEPLPELGPDPQAADEAWLDESGLRMSWLEPPLEDAEYEDGWDDEYSAIGPSRQSAEDVPGPGDAVFPAGFTRRHGAGPCSSGFAAGGALDLMEPCATLAGLAQDTLEAGLGGLSDDALVGLLAAARRLEAWQAANQLRLVAELDARRRRAPVAPGMPSAAEHVGEEIAAALTMTGRAAARLLDVARGLARLPEVIGTLSRGRIDRPRAEVFADELAGLGDVDAARVAGALIGRAAQMTTGQLRRSLRALVLATDPAAARRAAERGREDARVECWPEGSGNAALAGRELPVADVIAADERINAIARALKAAGAVGTLDQIRAGVFTALLLGRDPAALLMSGGGKNSRAVIAGAPEPAHGTQSAAGPGFKPAGQASESQGTAGQLAGPGLCGSVHLTMPVSAWLGLTDNPGEAARFGPLDAQTCRDLADLLAGGRAAWHVTLTGRDGRAVGHACARRGPPTDTGPPGPARPGGLAERLKWLHALPVTWLERDPCSHARRSTGYHPASTLAHLVQVRHITCAAPGCRRPARRCDLDHTLAWADGGLTCECGLAPLCRRHHRAKQAPGWHLDQPTLGTLTWTTPSGRRYTTQPEVYLP